MRNDKCRCLIPTGYGHEGLQDNGKPPHPSTSPSMGRPGFELAANSHAYHTSRRRTMITRGQVVSPSNICPLNAVAGDSNPIRLQIH